MFIFRQQVNLYSVYLRGENSSSSFAIFAPLARLDKNCQLAYIVRVDILLDASAVMAIILNEPNRDKVIKLTENSMLISCEVISFEVGNALVNLYRKQKITFNGVLEAYRTFELIPFRIVRVNMENALKIACNHKIYAYDAYYLEIANRLKMPLITFDTQMKRVGLDMNINFREEANDREENDEGISWKLYRDCRNRLVQMRKE